MGEFIGGWCIDLFRHTLCGSLEVILFSPQPMPVKIMSYRHFLLRGNGLDF